MVLEMPPSWQRVIVGLGDKQSIMAQLKQNEELDYFGFRLSGCMVKGQAGKDPHSILGGLWEYQSDTSMEVPSLGHHQGYPLQSYTRAHCLLLFCPQSGPHILSCISVFFPCGHLP